MQSMKQAIFQIGNDEFGMNIMDVIIIEKYIPVEQIPNLTKNLKGIIELRGDTIPIYSLRRKFGMEDIEPNEDTRYVLTNSNGILVAYEVDKMVEIVQLEQEQIFEVPSILISKDTSYMKLITVNNEKLVITLDQNGILSEEEQNKIRTITTK